MTPRFLGVWALSYLLVGGTSCTSSDPGQVTGAASRGPAPKAVQFADATQEAGIRFTPTNGAAGQKYMPETMGSGGAFLDFDDDGWLDILLLNGKPLGDAESLNLEPSNLEPAAGGRRWLRVRLAGRRLNPFAVGARVTLRSGRQRQTREVGSCRGYASASDFRLHFGLGEAATADSVTVRWPSGAETVVRDVATNREIVIQEK